MKIRPVGTESFHVDGQTDDDESSFANAPKNGM
jgi:hypothetical protein